MTVFSKWEITRIGQCAICENFAPLVQDHDHKTGQKRGKICNRCNIWLGRFNDNPTLLDAMSDYLKEWKRKCY